MNNSCDKEWTRKFLVSAFPNSFMTTQWKAVREKVILDREKALLPATQSVVEEEIAKEKIFEEVRQVDILIQQLQQRRNNLLLQHRTTGVDQNTERKQFVRACPDEHCRGYLSTQWKCGLCSKKTCPQCHVIMSDEHTCNDDDLATAKLLDADTKPCPKCATGIFKIDGCDQMWCTQCHTGFSWKTGRIEAHIHNPHFYEWQRRNNGGIAPRNPADLPCAQEITHQTTNTIRHGFILKGLSSQHQINSIVSLKKIEKVIEAVLHLRNVQLPTYTVNHVEDNLKLRVAFLRNRLTEKEFQVKLQRANKLYDKKKETGDVIRLFLQATTDIIFRLIHNLRTAKTMPDHVGILDAHFLEVERIRDYVNECLKDISHTFTVDVRTIRLYPHDAPTHPRDVLVKA